MVVQLVGYTLDVLGKILIAYSIFLVHGKMIRERKIDGKIIKEMKYERSLVLIGIAMIIIGYFLQLPGKL